MARYTVTKCAVCARSLVSPSSGPTVPFVIHEGREWVHHDGWDDVAMTTRQVDTGHIPVMDASLTFEVAS